MPKVMPDFTPLLKDCHLEPGASSFHTMSDGWRLHLESWAPPNPTAVIFHVHGLAESTHTLGVRRLAKMCLERNIALEAYELHAHGLSLQKGPKEIPPAAAAGCVHCPSPGHCPHDPMMFSRRGAAAVTLTILGQRSRGTRRKWRQRF